MTTRKKILLLASATLLCGVFSWRTTETHLDRRGGTAAANAITPDAIWANEPTRARSVAVATDATESLRAPTRREAFELVQALYRKEQLTRELDLEQRRYPQHYWQTERGGRELAKLQQARETILKELTAEANQVLRDAFPGETGEAITLTAIFSTERPGPNVSFLPPALRERFEAEILAAGDDGRGVERGRLLELAARVLPAEQVDIYRQWNEPAAAALRAQLVGFEPSESEFVALLRDQQSSGVDRESSAATGSLAEQLGSARFTELIKLRDPAMQTALHDLQRLGRPIQDAAWLAAARTRAITEIGEIWQNATLTETAKRFRVAQVESAYSQTVAAKLGLSEVALDGIEPSS